MFNIKRLHQMLNSDKLIAKWAKLRKNKHFTYGLPFVLLVVGAPHVLQHLFSVSIIYIPFRDVTFPPPGGHSEILRNNILFFKDQI